MGTESPTINSKFVGKKYKYFYSPSGMKLPPGEKVENYSIDGMKI